MDTATEEGSCSLGGSIGDPVEENQESREDMLSRHRREITELQNKEMALKKAAAKGSKAEQKAKKKQVEDEVLRLSSKLKEKHSEELASLGYIINTTNGENSKIDNLVKAIAGVSVSVHPNPSKPSKGAKRRDKRAQQEAAREQRIQEEQSSIVSDRMIENERLERKLEPLGLVVNEIKPDGHCLYRAIEDQLSLDPVPAPRFGYLELRKMAADYMRRNLADFLPFFLSEGKVEVESGDSAVERFEQYCEEVVSTAVWGGQLELGALAHCLEKHIVVYSGSFPDVEMGREYKSEDWSESSSSLSRSVMLSYHVHAYGLGEHYNSVVPRLN